ncbi:MAG: PIN domain-containing protein [Chloroflexi bacterium]|nr:PIN domain-containing protein [Chloroflexota bacterium]
MATEAGRCRAVFDTNVIVAALKSHNPRSPTGELLRRWEGGEFTLLYSADLRTEYEEKLAARQADPERANRFLARLDAAGVRVEVAPTDIRPVVTDDPDDDTVLACAVAGGATHLVTYDPHLLLLGEQYHGIRLLDGLHFLYLVRGDVPPADNPART